MKRVFRVAHRNLAHPWSVQWRPPLWGSFFIPLWRFDDEFRCRKTREEAEQEMFHAMAVEGYNVVVPPPKPIEFHRHTHYIGDQMVAVPGKRGECRLCKSEEFKCEF